MRKSVSLIHPLNFADDGYLRVCTLDWQHHVPSLRD